MSMFNNEKNKELISQIENMSDQEYEKFRLEKWEEKRNEKPKMPSFFLNDKQKYIEFLKQQQIANQSKGKKFSINIEEIETFDDKQWEEYRISQWEKKNAIYDQPLPEWYLQKDKYLQYLKNSFKK